MSAFEIDKLSEEIDIVVFDAVLHHIFWVDKKTGLQSVEKEITNLFTKIHALLRDSGQIIVRENGAHNIPYSLLTKLFGYKAKVNMSTKHHWSEWAKIIAKSGFYLNGKAIYWPYKSRHLKFMQFYPVLYFIPGSIDLVFYKSVKRN